MTRITYKYSDLDERPCYGVETSWVWVWLFLGEFYGHDEMFTLNIYPFAVGEEIAVINKTSSKVEAKAIIRVIRSHRFKNRNLTIIK